MEPIENMKNRVGLPPHPTDEFVHWTELDNTKNRMLELRKYYDELAALPGFNENAMSELLRAAYNTGQMDEHDTNAGAEL